MKSNILGIDLGVNCSIFSSTGQRWGDIITPELKKRDPDWDNIYYMLSHILNNYLRPYLDIFDSSYIVVLEDLHISGFENEEYKRILQFLKEGYTKLVRKSGARLELINPAGTSQICWECGTYGITRSGIDRFYCTNTLRCYNRNNKDLNAALNIATFCAINLAKIEKQRKRKWTEIFYILNIKDKTSVESIKWARWIIEQNVPMYLYRKFIKQDFFKYGILPE